MTKKIMQDVVAPSHDHEKNTLKNFPEPSRFPISREDISRVSRPTVNSPAAQASDETSDFLPKINKKPDLPPTEPPVRQGGFHASSNRSPRIVLWTVALLALLGAVGVTLSAFFSGATVKVTPLNKTVTLNADFTARENAADPGFVSYQKIILPPEQKSETVTPTVEKTISSKASGKIRIFNEYSSVSQRLIKNTRFESTSGKIYRINNSIVVPGMTSSGGKTSPGVVEVTVYADAPGDSFNTDLTDFSIPGFKGDPRYGKFYARSVTPITGGFVGTTKVPSPEDIAAAIGKLKSDLRTELIGQARSQVPRGFLMYDNAMFTVFSDDASAFSPQDPSHVTVSGSLYGAMFDVNALSKAIAEKAVSSYDHNPVLVRNAADLQLTVKGLVTDPSALKDFTFTLSGSPLVVWDVDYTKLKSDLAGVAKADGFKKVVGAVPAIWKAEAVVRPFWNRDFPQNPDKITIEEVLE